jgi:hypothetical protein
MPDETPENPPPPEEIPPVYDFEPEEGGTPPPQEVPPTGEQGGDGG